MAFRGGLVCPSCFAIPIDGPWEHMESCDHYVPSDAIIVKEWIEAGIKETNDNEELK